jgi:hypothetical protein
MAQGRVRAGSVAAPGAAPPTASAWDPGRRRRRLIGWVPLLLAALYPLVEVFRETAGGRPVLLDGDPALIELGAQRAGLLDQLVGVYSRYGFHEPGPAVFYLMAPFVRIYEPYGPGAYVAAVAVNGVAFIALVAVVRAWSGLAAAYWAAATGGLYLVTVGIDTFRQPWNPYMILMAMALFGLLVREHGRGRHWSGPTRSRPTWRRPCRLLPC